MFRVAYEFKVKYNMNSPACQHCILLHFSLMLMSLYNVSINSKGLKYISESPGFIPLLWWLLSGKECSAMFLYSHMLYLHSWRRFWYIGNQEPLSYNVYSLTMTFLFCWSGFFLGGNFQILLPSDTGFSKPVLAPPLNGFLL